MIMSGPNAELWNIIKFAIIADFEFWTEEYEVLSRFLIIYLPMFILFIV